jgi:hypothetical protein
MGLSLARFWRAFRISGGGVWTPQPPLGTPMMKASQILTKQSRYHLPTSLDNIPLVQLSNGIQVTRISNSFSHEYSNSNLEWRFYLRQRWTAPIKVHFSHLQFLSESRVSSLPSRAIFASCHKHMNSVHIRIISLDSAFLPLISKSLPRRPFPPNTPLHTRVDHQ